MKTNIQLLFCLILLTTACNDKAMEEIEERSQGEIVVSGTSCVQHLVGDKDGFGIGLKPNDSFVVEAGKALPIDYREIDDLFFTDVYPAWLGNSNSKEPVISFEVGFDKPAKSIIKAKLRMLTLGIQDGDSQVYNSDTDVKLFWMI